MQAPSHRSRHGLVVDDGRKPQRVREIVDENEICDGGDLLVTGHGGLYPGLCRLGAGHRVLHVVGGRTLRAPSRYPKVSGPSCCVADIRLFLCYAPSRARDPFPILGLSPGLGLGDVVRDHTGLAPAPTSMLLQRSRGLVRLLLSSVRWSGSGSQKRGTRTPDTGQGFPPIIQLPRRFLLATAPR
ncbi:hypothetical protein CALCODRAFT_315551 [Calocera cornea HHB12733]|uniref:Uncharacterized protein n=1 Tax=Calocera cornea HHB12733 TaxID=1353952 RepID=A0A165F9N3_9BASI|nr:hypothetical protein CALCODRAFT_315551 [Calocera cornea HHB12733]